MAVTEACDRATALTTWPPYKVINKKHTANIRMGRSHEKDWRPAAQMTPEVLSTASKVQEALDESKLCFADPSFKPTTLEQRRRLYLAVGFDEFLFPYQENIFKVTESIRKACKEVEEYKKEIKRGVADTALASIEEHATLVFDVATTLLAEFQKEVLTRHEDILLDPLSKDIRSQNKTAKALDLILLCPDGHNKYKKRLEELFEDKLCFRKNSQEDCWRWKGKVHGLRQLTALTTHATHALAKAAICLQYLEEHKNDASFFEASEQDKKEEPEVEISAHKRMEKFERALAMRTPLDPTPRPRI